jgi:neutral ceramidase
VSLRVGHAAARLDVARGTAMAGYVARPDAVSGELDPLEVGAVVLAGPSGTVAVLCVADLLQVDEEAARGARLAVASAVGTSPDLVWLTATHTHAGPAPGRVAEQVATAAVRAAGEAAGSTVRAAVTLHRPELAGVGGQRTGDARRSTVPVDVLRVSAGSRVLGVVGVLPVHPTVLGADNTRVSADLPGAVRRAVRRSSSAWCLVATGAAGDVSSRSHRREQTAAEVDRLGTLVGACLTSPGAVVAEATDVVGGRVTTLDLAPADPAAPFRLGAVEAARRALTSAEASGDPVRIREATVALQGAELGRGDTGPVPCPVSALDLGGLRLLGLGGEPFLDLAAAAATVDPATVLVGYANGYVGYLPTRHAFAAAAADPGHPSYEVLVSRVAPGESERALAAAGALLGSPR